MVRSSFGLASFCGGLVVLAATSTSSAQWLPFSGSRCDCGPRPALFGLPPLRYQSASAGYSSAAMPIYQTAMVSESVQCGQPINCTIEQPVQIRSMVQAVRVEPLQPVVHPVYDTVRVTEYQPVKQKVQKPIVETKWIDQAVTEMQPVTQQRTVNVPTVDYQSITEYKKVQKQVGYWVTKNEATGKLSPCQYDNRPGMIAAMNRTGFQLRNAFTPQVRATRQFIPQTMTCTVPCTKKVAVPGMKQVTYNVTSMLPRQTTRKVAVNSVRYVEEEVTAMKAVTVAKTMQIGTRISYAPLGSGAGGDGGRTALQPTPDNKASAQNSDGTPKRTANGKLDAFSPNLEPDSFNENQGTIRKSSYPTSIEQPTDQGRMTESIVPARAGDPTTQPMRTPSVVRVSQWVARDAMSLAGNIR
ncbi:MAG: hypothetical protein NTW75_12315 [Planctomycetales bacterium]|nr:hypothetical protein [Planctomycetales bacterium]